MRIAATNVVLLVSVLWLIPILVGVYVFRDAKQRGMNAILWTLVAVFAPSLIGLVVYLLVRGNYSNLRCPRCDTVVTEQFVVCPKCGAKLRPNCPNCSSAVEPDWAVCPRCAQPLTAVQEDIVSPVRPKDHTLWKVLVAIILIPAMMILLLSVSFTGASGGGSSALQEVAIDEYYADQEIPESTKEYVRQWLEGIVPKRNHAYALRYTYRIDPNSKSKDYYYLIYVPDGADATQRGFGYSGGLFGTSFELHLEDTKPRGGLYCVMTTSDKTAPKLRVTVNKTSLKTSVTVVDFNPTVYTIASESDYSGVQSAFGSLYVESEERAMMPELLTFTKYEDGQQKGVAEFDTSDYLLDTVVGIHELHHLEEVPAVLKGYQLEDYCTISILFIDDTGMYHYEDVCSYLVIKAGDLHYLLEIGMDSQIEDILQSGQITGEENLFVYEISEEGYSALLRQFV